MVRIEVVPGTRARGVSNGLPGIAMPPPETVFIINPRAGGGSTARHWPRIAAEARRVLGSFGAVMTRSAGEAGTLAAAAAAKGAQRLVVVGGDGTLNEVLQAVMTLEQTARERLTIGIIPNGTGCDFARSASIPMNWEKALVLIEAMPVKTLDVGRIAFRNFQP